MADIDRREFAGILSAAGLAPALSAAVPSRLTRAVEAPPNVTRTLAGYVVRAKPDDIPAPIVAEARRTLVNWVGCALGGARHETLDHAIAALQPFSGPQQATVLGRAERMDALTASLMNGMSSHVLDFDDTHLKTVIHPAGPVAPAILALAEMQPISGRDFLHALILGVEVECRIGNAVYPAHYDRGWHITGTAGVFGAAAACGKLLGLSETQMVWALGLAAAQPVGLREMFGSMTKSFHPGRAAQNGFTAAVLAAKNFTSTDVGLEGKSGWVHVLSTESKWDEITGQLGERFELRLNTYKPFACGVVMHPTIDACLQLREKHRLTADQIERIDLSVHPLVLELTGKRAPQTGLEGKFSIYYAAAIAIVAGGAGPKQFSDALVRDPVVVALRDRVTATVTPGIGEAQVKAAITLKDGRRLEQSIEQVVGSVERPMSDADLDRKFLDLADGAIAVPQARKLLDLCRNIDRLPKAGELASAGGATG
ncbi:MAG TPA: MmgE/PrpD family protein [Vicinamibacterales bacterium]|nr:MmgE/PrpD family protein [Vicinamibacterales bacterium]